MKRIEEITLADDNPKEIVKENLEEIFKTDIYVSLHSIDPRIMHFDCFGNVENFNKLTEIYSNIKIEDNSKIIVYCNQSYPIINFTIYNVKDDERQELINKVENEYIEKYEQVKKDQIIF